MPQTLAQMEAAIVQLSLSDQIDLIERLIRIVRQRTVQPLATEADLALMAADPAIQRELHQIAAEFVVTELDGLDSTTSPL